MVKSTRQSKYINEANILYWLQVNELSLNLNKTKYMPFGAYKDSIPNNLNIIVNNINIELTYEMKYLGVIIDPNMRWDRHMSYVLKKNKISNIYL